MAVIAMCLLLPMFDSCVDPCPAADCKDRDQIPPQFISQRGAAAGRTRCRKTSAGVLFGVAHLARSRTSALHQHQLPRATQSSVRGYMCWLDAAEVKPRPSRLPELTLNYEKQPLLDGAVTSLGTAEAPHGSLPRHSLDANHADHDRAATPAAIPRQPSHAEMPERGKLWWRPAEYPQRRRLVGIICFAITSKSRTCGSAEHLTTCLCSCGYSAAATTPPPAAGSLPSSLTERRITMYGLGPWRDSKLVTVAGDRQEHVEAHSGTPQDFLRRHERAAFEAASGGYEAMHDIGPCLLKRAADTRNLRLAWDFLRRHGGPAPGPNGLTYSDLAEFEVWELLRVLSGTILGGTYRSGPDRKVSISKGQGRGQRVLRLQDIQDRVVHRAVAQIIGPLLDPTFDDNSDGFRPNRNRCHALAKAMHHAQQAGRMVWVVADIKDAFDHVPLRRLLDIVRKRIPNADDLAQLVERIVDNGTKRGLRQGSPLSPLLLNLYLDHVLDRPWRRKQPDTPLLRTADDILLVGRTESEALKALDHLRHTLTAAGMPLKETPGAAIRNLNTNKADWLGFEVAEGASGLEVRIAEAAWDKLAELLERAHTRPAGPLRAAEIVSGWMDQQGPCLPHEEGDQVIARVDSVAREMAFDELPDAEELLTRWRRAHARWNALVAATGAAYAAADDSSASRHDFCAAKSRSDGASSGASSLSFSSDETVMLYTDGSCDRFTGRGGWAAIFVAPSLSQPFCGSGRLNRTTNNRAELIAVIKALERLAAPTRLQLVSDSQYVVLGITERLPKWKQQGWRAGSGRHRRDLLNADLWQVLDALLSEHLVSCKWVRGHAGCRWNEECDRLAKEATV
jgi:ribonuclease HI